MFSRIRLISRQLLQRNLINMKFPCETDEGYLQVLRLGSIEHNGEALKDTKLNVVGFYVYVTTYSKWENRMLLPVVTSIKAIIRKGRICVAMRALGDRSNRLIDAPLVFGLESTWPWVNSARRCIAIDWFRGTL